MINAKIIGEIDDLTEVFTQIEDATEDVELLINSPGGNAMEALQIVNAISKCGKKVTAHVEVQAMSAAAVIALGCPNVTMDSKAIIMLHNCWTVGAGNAKDLQQEVDAMKAVDNALQDIVTTHCTEENAAFIKAKMDDGEVWLTGRQCAELFENVTLLEKEQPQGLKAAAGSLADLVDLYNALLAEKQQEEKEEAAAPEEEKPPAEEQEEEKQEPKDEAAETPAETTPEEAEEAEQEAETPAAPVKKRKQDMYSAEILAICDEVF